VETSINHRGKSLALLLISYAICYLKQIHSNTRYVSLDDCSDNSHKIEKNLYHKLGFVSRDLTALSMYDSTELKLCGPEKQLLINKGFLQKARDVNSLEQRRNLSHKSHKSHKSHLITKARRSLKSAALEQLKKEYTLNYPEKGKGRKSRKRNNSTRMLKKHKKHKKQIPTTRKRNKIRTSTRRHY
jgi:hypothetical protein